MPPQFLTDLLGFSLLMMVAGGENRTTINLTWQIESRARETAECDEGSDVAGQQSQDKNSIWPDWDSSGGHCFRWRRVTPALAAVSKDTISIHKENTLFFFQFLLNSVTAITASKYSYHFCKWVRICITYCVTVLSMSTPPMLLHTEQLSGYLTLKRRYSGSENETWQAALQLRRSGWTGGKEKSRQGESTILCSRSSTPRCPFLLLSSTKNLGADMREKTNLSYLHAQKEWEKTLISM